MRGKDLLTARIDCDGNGDDQDENHARTKSAVKGLKAQGFEVEWTHSHNNPDRYWKAFKVLLFGDDSLTLREILLGTD